MKFSLKSFVMGFMAGLMCLTTAFAAGGLRTAAFVKSKIVFDGNELSLGGREMISAAREGEAEPVTYAPVYNLLMEMGYEAEWDSELNAIKVSSPSIAALPTLAGTLGGAAIGQPQAIAPIAATPNTAAMQGLVPVEPGPEDKLAAERLANANTELKEGETYTYYKNGEPLYSVTLKKAAEEKHKETQIVDLEGNRILQVEFEYENHNYPKEMLMSNYKFTGINDKSFSASPYAFVKGFTRSDYLNNRTYEDTTFRSASASWSPMGSKSGGKLLFPVKDSKTLRVHVQYKTYEGMGNGLSWDFVVGN